MTQYLKVLVVVPILIALLIPGLVCDVIAGIGSTGSRYIVAAVDYLEKWADLNQGE
jgi:hypothetical protein